MKSDDWTETLRFQHVPELPVTLEIALARKLKPLIEKTLAKKYN